MIDKIQLSIWGREFTLPIVYECYSGETILKSQVESAKEFVKHVDIINSAKKLVEEYSKSQVESDETNTKKDNIFSYIKPECFYVKREKKQPKIALMCKYRYDEEHGIAIVVDCKGKVTVGSQDIIL